MNLPAFKDSLGAGEPPADLARPLLALWHDAKGDWQAAHECIQDQEDQTGAWIHAYLHRKEGDLANAGYWYRRAGKPVASQPLEAEWESIAAALLAAS